jgi:hypothetical protein
MGDRGNVVVLQHESAGNVSALVYLYSHWGGHDLPEALQSALKRGRERWTDEPYLTRIIFCEMVDGHEKDTAGFGITTYLTDNEHPLLVVDVKKETVSAAKANAPLEPYKTLSFEAFCALEGDALENFRKP